MPTKKEYDLSHPDASLKTNNLVGFYSAILTAVLTVVTFGFAIVAVPISGAFCLQGCITYPYLDSVAQYPHDYRWMVLALVLTVSYLILMAAIRAYASREKKLLGQIGLYFALISAAILLVTYFTQVSIVPISLIKGETDGIALLTQYNPHGIFIALEELAYLLMSLSFLFMGLALENKSRVESAARWFFIGAFVLVFVLLAFITGTYGLDREYRFEVAAISVDWLALIINGILFAILFRRKLKAAA